MSEFISKSGAKVIINLAPWQDAKQLKMAIARVAAQQGIKFENLADSFFALVFQLHGAPEVDATLSKCLIRCTRNDQKITDETFNDGEARHDYHEIVKACLKENLGPLAEEIFSEFAVLFKNNQAPPKNATPK